MELELAFLRVYWAAKRNTEDMEMGSFNNGFRRKIGLKKYIYIVDRPKIHVNFLNFISSILEM